MRKFLIALALVACTAATAFAQCPDGTECTPIPTPKPLFSLSRVSLSARTGFHWQGDADAVPFVGVAGSYSLGRKTTLSGAVDFPFAVPAGVSGDAKAVDFRLGISVNLFRGK